MRKRNHMRATVLGIFLAVLAISSSARADDVPLITGEHWTKSSEQLKKAYLVGIANVLQVEMVYEGGNPPTDAQSIAPRFAKGVKGQTLDSVREALDKWYAAHPDRLQRPVIETIWFEIVVPGLEKSK
jgi:hypothetical protein